MKPGKVVGRVVATQKDPSLEGITFLLIQCTDWKGRLLDETMIAADTVGAGAAEWIIYVEARDASMAVHSNPPIDAAVVGIIDDVEVSA